MSIGGKEALIRVVYGSLSRSGPADGGLFSPSSAAVRDHPLVGTWTEDDILNGFASSIATGRTEELLTHIRRAVNSATSVAANTAAFGAMRSAPEDFDDEEEGIGSTMIAAMHQRQEARNVDEVFRAIFTTLGRS
ncbi:hypothetical protein HDU89_000639 [Geranomyces variabilis]|nr:hypothetical protein HDU89_000639 [Geranomyces variabilis]KAJ3160518.1 hypothetical protein HDU88_007929 [Geranomyces variabilis]